MPFSETVVLLLQKTGRDHVRRKIHAKQFEVIMFNPFLYWTFFQ
jgi:hypothetical protein